jgi:DNA-3-methyladenine glycosylase
MPYEPPLQRRYYNRDVVRVARELLGRHLIHESAEGTTIGRIVEVEAYLPEGDSSCHGARGQTRRNASLFGPPGHAYVYAIHSRWCLNAVAEPENVACAALIRAVEPLEGLDLMRTRRQREAPLDLARGPGRLCQAFGIDRALDGWDLTLGERLWIAATKRPLAKSEAVAISPRIGVTSAHEMPLRFFLAGNRWVSGKRSMDHAWRRGLG